MSEMAETPEETETVLQRELDAELPRRQGSVALAWQPHGNHMVRPGLIKAMSGQREAVFHSILVRSGRFRYVQVAGNCQNTMEYFA